MVSDVLYILCMDLITGKMGEMGAAVICWSIGATLDIITDMIRLFKR